MAIRRATFTPLATIFLKGTTLAILERGAAGIIFAGKRLRARKWREGALARSIKWGKNPVSKKKWKKKTSASAGPHLPCCVLTVRLCASSPWHDLPRFFPPRRMSPTTADVSTHILNICRSCYDLGQSVHGCADQSSRQTFTGMPMHASTSR